MSKRSHPSKPPESFEKGGISKKTSFDDLLTGLEKRIEKRKKKKNEDCGPPSTSLVNPIYNEDVLGRIT